MEMWTEVRRRVLTGELSKRAACQEYGINWRTRGKMLAHVEPPGYRRKAKREQPVLGPHVSWIHEVLEQDKQEPKKQRHTAKRIFDRLRAEKGYTGGYTMVKEAVRAWKDVTKENIVNCWNRTKTLPCAAKPVIMHDKVFDELKQLLLDFGAATDGDVCTAEEYIDVEAERWTETLESDDDENPLAAVLEECEEPCRLEACENDSVDVKGDVS
jgi:hypothetical protein